MPYLPCPIVYQGYACLTWKTAYSSCEECRVIIEPHLISASKASKRTAQETDWKKCEEELQIALAMTLSVEKNKPKPKKVVTPATYLTTGNEIQTKTTDPGHLKNVLGRSNISHPQDDATRSSIHGFAEERERWWQVSSMLLQAGGVLSCSLWTSWVVFGLCEEDEVLSVLFFRSGTCAEAMPSLNCNCYHHISNTIHIDMP